MAWENAHIIILGRKKQNARLYYSGVHTHTREENCKISAAVVCVQEALNIYSKYPNF